MGGLLANYAAGFHHEVGPGARRWYGLGMRSSFTLTRIAETSDRFTDFAPYVSSVSDAGAVAFQATLRGGGSGVFVGDGGEVTQVVGAAGVVSHPDINSAGSCCFYAELGEGRQGVML